VANGTLKKDRAFWEQHYFPLPKLISWH
jgi:hypothetical protein